MSIAAITRHNIKEDFREHSCVYSVPAVLAIALIVFSTQMYHIDALKGIDSNIFLGAGGGILAIEVIALLKRNVSYYVRYKFIIKEILIEGYYCPIMNDGVKKFLVFSQTEKEPREYDELPEEFPQKIPPQVLMKALGKKNNLPMPSDRDIDMTILKLYLRDNEYIKVKKSSGEPGDFVLAGKQGILWELIRKPEQYSSEQTLDVLKLRYEMKHGDTRYDQS